MILRLVFPPRRGATAKGGSSKTPTGSKTVHLKRKKESSSVMYSNLSQTLASTLVVVEMYKEDQQAIGGPTSLGVTSEARANPQLCSGMSTFNLNEPIYLASFIIHSESASGNDALVVSIAEADPGKSAPSTDPHVLVDKTQSISEGTIKLEDLAKLVASVQPSFKDLDSLEDDPIIVVNDSDEDEEADEVHATTNAKTEDASVPKSSSPISSPIQELTNQVLILQSQKHKLELEKNKAKVEFSLLRAQPSFPNIGQLNELLLKEIPTKLEDFTKIVTSLTSQVAELKTLKWELLPEFLSVPTQVEAVASKKTKDDSVPSAGQAEHIKKDKGKIALSSEEAKKESTDSDSDDDETRMTVSMVESSRMKKVKQFDFITKDGKHIHLTGEQINQQKKIEEEAKAKAAKRESKVRKEELVHLLSPEVVNKYYNDKIQCHQGPRLDDHARTISSLLFTEVDKRNLNPLKQMRTFEQLRQ
ncbi:hypothetical protein Tco_1081382 [Tanacetum coccineum]|uniref:Uncharacterized protein n=1 Tax=Tanacetum coccineum TaxID=301880 RepID=A0ABQ5HXF1_9ASTR